MRHAFQSLLGATLATAAIACGGATSTVEDPGGEATIAIADKQYKVNKVHLWFEGGEDGYFRVEGDDAARPNEDCLPGLSSGMALYGGVPENVTSVADLNGRELPFEFTGDGDDHNLCFVGTDGLLGVERGTVRFTVVDDKRVQFTFSGSFVVYDGSGGQKPAAVNASGNGVAHVDTP
jgi:hypothetical protein